MKRILEKINRTVSVRKPGQSKDAVVGGNKKRKSILREYIEAIGIALLVALFVRTFIVQAFKIPSGSMIPTLQIGDYILVSKLAYGIRIPFWGRYMVRYGKPKRGDVVVFVFPKDRSKDFIKRVIGIEGDLVEIRRKKIYINGELLADPYAYFTDDDMPYDKNQTRDNYGPTRIPENQLFVMGDNRDQSYDSRFWGFVNLCAVKGKAFIIYWSWNESDRWVRWNRIGHMIHGSTDAEIKPPWHLRQRGRVRQGLHKRRDFRDVL